MDPGILLAGAICAAAVTGAILLDFAIGAATGADLQALPRTALDHFAELERSPLLGLYRLDLLNALVQVLTIPVYVAPRELHRPAPGGRGHLPGLERRAPDAASPPMLQLAAEAGAAGSEPRRAALAVAGEALLARGAHWSLGPLPAFWLVSGSGLVMSVAMLAGRRLPRPAGWAGLLGNGLLLLVALVAFVPSAGRLAMVLAMPGGLLALAWILLIEVGLLRAWRELARSGAARPAAVPFR